MDSGNGIGRLADSTPLVTTPTVAAGREQQVKTASAGGTPGSKAGEAVDQASISSTSELLAAALSASDVRLDKILPLQVAIANGTYNVSSQDVAEKLISSLIR